MKNTFLIFFVLLISGTTLNAQWMELVTPTVNFETAGFLDLEINLEGEPYLLYDCAVPSDDGKDSQWKLFVQKYDAANEEWSLVGNSYINEYDAYQNHLAIDSEGSVYVAFYKLDWDVVTNRWCTVKKFDGTVWTTIGEWNNWGSNSEVTMYCNNQNEVYVSYWDTDTYSGAVVKRYLGTGSNWETLGDAPFLETQCLHPSITTDNDGNVLVAFGGDDYGGSLPLSVKKFNGSTWEYVGTSGFGDEPVVPTSIIVGNDDVVHTTTNDFWSLASTVHSYQNNSWQGQFIAIYAGNMPFAKYNNDVYMGHFGENGYHVNIKKYDDSGNWTNIPEQPDPYFTADYYSTIDIETDNLGNLYLTLAKGDIWNSHVAVAKLDITTGISNTQKEEFTVYPNPTSGIVNLTGFGNLLGFEITDLTGKTICRGTRGHVPLPLQIDLSNLRKGVYFMNINTSKNNYIKKLIIQ